MRTIPAELAQLRLDVASSIGWWHRGRRVTDAERADMSDSQRAEVRWSGNPELTRQLVEAERAFTRSFQ